MTTDEHVPEIGQANGLTWITCSCGWVSPAMLSELEARSRWGQHEAGI